MLRQQHFMHQRKNLHIPILGRIFSGELISEDNYRFFRRSFFNTAPDFIWDSGDAGGYVGI